MGSTKIVQRNNGLLAANPVKTYVYTTIRIVPTIIIKRNKAFRTLTPSLEILIFFDFDPAKVVLILDVNLEKQSN